MIRRAHILRPNETCEQPQQAVWFDTESHIHKVATGDMWHSLWFGWACYRRRVLQGEWGPEDWFRFTSPIDFWRWCTSKVRNQSKLWMFCHNTSFDLPILDTFHVLKDLGWKLNTAIIDAPPTILTFRQESKTIEIIDTLNIWRMSLAEMSSHIDLPKLQMPGHQTEGPEWDIYCKRDVQVIMTCLLEWWKFLETNNFGGFSPTIASQAMRVFRHRYMRDQILIDADPQSHDLARRALHGGRCECFHIGKLEGDFYLLDVNSLYPYVMSEFTMPIVRQTVTRHLTVWDLHEVIRSRSIVASVLVNITEPVFPTTDTGKLVFPTGRFECVLTTPEVSYALERGWILSVRDVAIYSQALAFREMMLDIWQLRRRAKEANDAFSVEHYKKLMNSFYGKWGQRGVRWSTVAHCDDSECKTWDEIDYDEHTVTRWRKFCGILQRCEQDGESYNSHPAIAGHITAYGRMELWKWIVRAGSENVLYVDTDCLLVTRAGFDRLIDFIDPLKLGALKIEGHFSRVQIFGCKDYVFDSKVKIKGIRRQARIVGPNTFEQEKWTSLRGMLRAGDFTRPQTKIIRKVLSRQYDKGIVLPDGRIRPYHLF